MQQKERVTGIKPVARSFSVFRESVFSYTHRYVFGPLWKVQMDGMVCSIPELHGFFESSEIVFKDRYGVVHSNRDNQTVSFSCQTKASFMEFQKVPDRFHSCFLVPSGKMQTEIPDLISSIPDRMVFSPFFISFRSRKRQWR